MRFFHFVAKWKSDFRQAATDSIEAVSLMRNFSELIRRRRVPKMEGCRIEWLKMGLFGDRQKARAPTQRRPLRLVSNAALFSGQCGLQHHFGFGVFSFSNLASVC
jgi:hypothetical protein